MDSGTNFWLIYIQDRELSVSLISQVDHHYQILGTGLKKEWDIESEESFITAVDESLSAASLNSGISEDQEPSQAAFVVPPFWIGNDGKINAPKLKLIKSLCKKLTISPTGFLPEDEAIVEESNQQDNFPASFIVLHLNPTDFYLSLVYMGHVKERIRKTFSDKFTGKILESALLEFNSDSALPPQILIFGSVDEALINDLKNFPWIGRKDIETFLHFPDIKSYSEHDILNIFSKVIIGSQTLNSAKESELLEGESPENQEVAPMVAPVVEEISLEEIDASDLGFSTSSNEISPQAEKKIEIEVEAKNSMIPEPNLDPFVPEIVPLLPTKKLPKIKISFNFLKKIKIPKIKFNTLFWLFLIIFPFLVITPLFLTKANVTLFITPYQFNKSVDTTLKVNGDNSNLDKVIPAGKQVLEITATEKINTTGEKTVGERAKGEIIIYNKVDEAKNIPQGSILVDNSGKKFELTTAVSVASSSSNLEEGVINLGQTKTVAIASDIGSEFNISKDTQLKFQDFEDTILIAKVDSDFSGGSKRQISAVSSEDKNNLEEKVNQTLLQNINDKIKNDLESNTGAIKETIQTQKSQLDFSREIGEETDELSVVAKSSVTVFTLSSDIKEEVVRHFLSDQPDFNNIDFNINDFNLTFKISTITDSQASGELTITGASLPNLDLDKIKKSISAKTKKAAEELIKKSVNRAYNFNIQNDLPLLPFRWQNINIQIKSENL